MSSVSISIPLFETVCQFVKVFKKGAVYHRIFAHFAVDSIDAHAIIITKFVFILKQSIIILIILLLF